MTNATVSRRLSINSKIAIVANVHVPRIKGWDMLMSEIERELAGTIRESLHNSERTERPLCLKSLGKIEHRKALFKPGIVHYEDQGAVLEYHYAVVQGDKIPSRLTLSEAKDAIDRETDFAVCFP